MRLMEWLQKNAGEPFLCGEDVLIRDLHICFGQALSAVATLECLDSDCIVAVQLAIRSKDFWSRTVSALWKIHVFAPRDVDGADDGLTAPWICPCGLHAFGDFRVCAPRVVECDVDAWFSSQPKEWIANFHGSVSGMPSSWPEITLWNTALESVLRKELSEIAPDEASCNQLADILSSLYPSSAINGFDLRIRVSVKKIRPKVPMWLDWASDRDGPNLRSATIWDFAKEAWKPVLPFTGITFADFADYDTKGAAAFNSFMRARLVRPSEVIAAWERGTEYSFKKKHALAPMEQIRVLELTPDELIPGPPVPRSQQRLGIYKRKPAVE